jgi:peptide/nickel transport system substrate-binding protein
MRSITPRRIAEVVAIVCAISAMVAIPAASRAATTGSLNAAAAPSVLRIGSTERAETSNSDLAVDPTSLIILHLTGGYLTNVTGANKVVPGLASSYSQSADRLTWTFHLRPGLKFSDGSPLTSNDVKASFDWMRADKANVNSGFVADWKAVTAPNASTVEIKLKQPQGSLPAITAGVGFGIYPAKGISNPKSFFAQPAGQPSSGEYQITAWTNSGAEVTLQRNPNYWGPKPVVPKLEVIAIQSPSTGILELKNNQLDIMQGLPPSTIGQLSGHGVTGYVVPNYGGYYLYLNDRHSPLSNVNVRRAISLAVNRTQMKNIAFLGKSTVLTGLFPTTMAEHASEPSVFPPTPNLSAAKRLLAGTPCANGCSMVLDLRAGEGDNDSLGVIVQQNLEAIGIHLHIQMVDNTLMNNNEIKGRYQMEVNGLVDAVDRPDLYCQWGLEGNLPIQALYSGYTSAAMNSACDAAGRGSPGSATRAAAVKTINKLFAQAVPYVPLLDNSDVVGSRVPPSLIHLNAGELFDVETS